MKFLLAFFNIFALFPSSFRLSTISGLPKDLIDASEDLQVIWIFSLFSANFFNNIVRSYSLLQIFYGLYPILPISSVVFELLWFSNTLYYPLFFYYSTSYFNKLYYMTVLNLISFFELHCV